MGWRLGVETNSGFGSLTDRGFMGQGHKVRRLKVESTNIHNEQNNKAKFR